MKRAFLILPLIAIFLFGCDSAITDSTPDDKTAELQSEDVLNQSAFDKKNDNKGGGKPGGGGGNDAYPTYSNVTVEPLGLTSDFTNWYDPNVMRMPSVVSTYQGGVDPSGFFGCPDSNKPCYRITVTLDQADAGDAVAVRIFPFEEDARCDVNGCPADPSLDDGTTNPPRRALSLFDDYLGTPFVGVEAFTDGTYSFYWQGQLFRRYYNSIDGEGYHGYFRYDRDPDDGGPDLLRAEATFYDASSDGSGYLSGTSLTEIDQCASANPIETHNGGCVFRHEGASSAMGYIESRIESVSEPTRGRGRDKTSTTTISVTNSLNGTSEMKSDGGSDVWVVYLIDNVIQDGSHVRTIEATSNNSFTVAAREGCLLIRPVQAELWANNPTEFNSAFSADENGEWIYDVDANGALTETTAGSYCSSAYSAP